MSSVDVVIPVYNEEHSLPVCIATLSEFLAEHLTNRCRIVIADNGSVDGTLGVARALSEQYAKDVDLSTKLDVFPELIRSLDEGYDVAIGSRLMRGSKTTRSFKRELTSRGYNLLIKALFFSSFSDAQCGFKAVKYSVVQEIIPLIRDQAWFFDTELLLLALKKGYRIKEVPVEWVEDPDTRVRVLKTAWEDIKGLLRVRFCSP